MKMRRAIACLLGLLLAIQPAFAARLPRCAHGDGPAHAAMAHAGHAGHHAMQGHGHDSGAPKRCDCGCLGAMAGCAHAASTVAMSERLVVATHAVRADAPALPRDPTFPSARSEPPLRPPTLA